MPGQSNTPPIAKTLVVRKKNETTTPRIKLDTTLDGEDG
jgi:hypothetical protein